MEILLSKETTDKDLKTGMQVCYQNLQGAFCKLGIITDFYFYNGTKKYLLNTAMGSYFADELKLIKQ